MIDFCGKQIQIQQLSKRYNVPWNTINNRYQRGIRGHALISKQPLTHIDFKGEFVGWTDLTKRFNIPLSTLVNRYNDGLRDDDLVKKSHRGKLSKNAAKKLTKNDVIEIKTLLLNSTLTQKEIALRFNVDPSHISDIKRGKRWPEIVIDVSKLLPKN